MPFKEVNLTGGLNLQDSDIKKGFNEFQDLLNLRHENGSLVKRYGTGTAVSVSSANIDNMAIFVHRKLQAVKIAAGTCNVEFDHSEKRINLSDMAGVDIPGFADTDLRAVFKAGDTIYINYSGTSANEGVYIIESVVDADTLEVNRGFDGDADETLSSGTVTMGFSYADYNDAAPTSILAADDNSFDGRAFLTTYTNTNKFLALINPLDYSDKIDLIDFGAGSEDMHIRPVAYTDAVRIACGLEYDPRIFRYVNRHHFNGMLKSAYNANADLLYPRWVIDTAVPVVTANTMVLNNSSVSDLMNTNERLWEIDGALDIKNNTYVYKFIPVYDGNQEGLLENHLIIQSTSNLSTKKTELSGVLSTSKSALKIEVKIDIRLLNPRMSGINVYRSTNGGTYYKIKSIYLGDDDPNQETQTFKGGDDAFWFKGDNTPGSSTLDSVEMIVDGFMYEIEAGATPSLDYEGTGYSMVSLENSAVQFDHVVTDDSTASSSALGCMSPEYYGSYYTSKWNHPSEATDIIYADNGEARGGSANGGWYFANATELNTAFSVSDAISGSSITCVNGETTVSGPFATAFATANQGDGSMNAHYGCTNTGSQNESMDKWVLGTGVATDETYIVSGWIKASGFNSSDAKWRVFVSGDSGHNTYTAEGQGDIAHGVGGSENQNIDKWRWFQFEVENPSSTSLYIYVYIYAPNNGCETNAIRMKALSVRQKVGSYGLTDNMVGYCGKNVGVSSGLDDLGFAPGTLKGNSIQTVDDHPTIPTADSADRTIITDNNGAFLRASSILPLIGLGEAPVSDSCFFGTSNYQFYTVSTGASAHTSTTHVMLDFYDTGLPDGARHPNETATSTDVKFKYATMLNGRQFVGNVKITGDEDTEEYPNFIMFSEPNSPDVIPTTNYIQLQDLQGGEIVGIETLMSDLVVFMTNGIFRLSVPSNNPTSWSLVEAHPNIGGLHDKAICKVPNGIFVATRDDIVFLDSGFSATPITQKIRTTYQSQARSNPDTLRLSFDAKYNRLRLLYSNTTDGDTIVTKFYLYDISRGVWTQETHTGVAYDEVFSKDTNENIFIVSDSTSTIRDAEYTASWQDGGSTAIQTKIHTGEENIAPFGTNARVRRINTSIVAASTGADLNLRMNGSVAHESLNVLNGQQSTRPYTLNAGSTAAIIISDTNNQDVKIEKVEIEYE